MTSRARAGLMSIPLAAALVVPWLFAPFTDRVFEAEKAALLRALAVAVLAIGATAASRPGWRAALAARWRGADGAARGIVAAGLALWLVDALATFASRAPWLSALGSDDRGFGWLTLTALAAMAAGAAVVAGAPGGADRLAAFVGASALPPALYGLFQRAGADPLPWLGDVVTRVSGSAGASVLLGAHLVVALPFALAATAAALRDAGAGGPGQARLAAWLVVDGAALAALVLSGSRGPVLAAAAALVVAALAVAARHRRRGAALGIAVAAALAVGGVVALNARPAAFGPLLRVGLVQRLSVALDPERSTTRVRLRLWEGTVDAIAGLGARTWLGTGPETMPLVWAPSYPTMLAYDEPRGWVPDRAHNLWLDRALTTGVLGAAALLAVIIAGLVAVVRRAGLAGSGRDAAVAATVWLGSATAAAVTARLADGAWRLAPAAFGLGLVAGLAAWLTARAVRGTAALPPSPAPPAGLEVAVLASLTAFVVETQVGFPVVASSLVVALGLGALAAGAPRPGEAGAHHLAMARASDGPFAAAVVAVVGLYAFGRSGLVGPGAPGAVALVGLAAATVGLAVGGRPSPPALARSVAIVLAALAGHGAALALGADGPSDAVPAAALTLAVLALALTALVATHAIAAAAGDPSHGPAAPGIGTAWRALVAVATGIAIAGCLSSTVADALAKEGRVAWEDQVAAWRARGDLGRAEALLDGAERRYRRAAALAPWSPRYRLALGMAADVRGDLRTQQWMADTRRAAADAVGNAAGAPQRDAVVRRDAAFEAAIEHFAAAMRLAPGDPTAALALARAWRLWGDLTDEPARRADRLDHARAAYAAARALAPRWPEVIAESATVELLVGRPAVARELAETAVALDGYYYQGWKTVAAARAAGGDAAGAADAWRRYFADPRNAGDVAALRARAAAALQAGDTADAIDTARAAARLAPDDARVWADLAVALDHAGDPVGALDAAERAAALSPGDAGIRGLVDDLRAGRTP